MNYKEKSEMDFSEKTAISTKDTTLSNKIILSCVRIENGEYWVTEQMIR